MIGKKLTYEEAQYKVSEVSKDFILDKKSFKTFSNDKVKITHTKCGKSFLVLPKGFFNRKNKCPFCNNGNYIHKSKINDLEYEIKTKIYKDELLEYTKGEYILLGKYINNKTKVKLFHEECGREIECLPKFYLRGRSACRECAYKNRGVFNKKNTTIFKEEVKNLDPEYSVDSEYITKKDYIIMTHTKCGTQFKTKPERFKNDGNRCPLCTGKIPKTSQKSEFILKYIKDKDIDIVTEMTFDGCIYKRSLNYDFYLPDKNTLIEFDGVQHFKKIRSSVMNKSFDVSVKRDWIKNNFARDKKINLIRIPYSLSTNTISKIIDKIIIGDFSNDIFTSKNILVISEKITNNLCKYYTSKNIEYFKVNEVDLSGYDCRL